MSELIDREVVIAELELECDADMEDPYWSGVNAGLKTAIAKIKCMPSAEPTHEQVVEYCRKRCLAIVDDYGFTI